MLIDDDARPFAGNAGLRVRIQHGARGIEGGRGVDVASVDEIIVVPPVQIFRNPRFPNAVPDRHHGLGNRGSAVEFERNAAVVHEYG